MQFNERWFCSVGCLEAEARALISEARHLDRWVPPRSVPLGRLLVKQRVVSPEAVKAALVTQRRSGRRLGDELIAMRATTPVQVLRALAAQAGTGCVTELDAARVSAAPGGLSPIIVELLRVVPFDANAARQRLAVACTGPLPGNALAAVRRMTGWEVQPFLVAESLLDRLIEAYGGARPRSASVAREAFALREAAASIARAARLGLARRMQYVRCDALVWVRLEGEAHAEDFVVALEPLLEDTSWQAAPTPH